METREPVQRLRSEYHCTGPKYVVERSIVCLLWDNIDSNVRSGSNVKSDSIDNTDSNAGSDNTDCNAGSDNTDGK